MSNDPPAAPDAGGADKVLLALRDQPQSFLLKVWPVDDAAGTEWRCSLENVVTHARAHFGSLEKLASFLASLSGTHP
jgi:hypothetical protein